MTNNATKFLLGLAVAGIVASVAPGVLHMAGFEPAIADDKVARLLFVGVFLAGAAVAFGIGRAVGADLPPAVEAGAATPLDPADAPRASYGPLLAAIGATVLAAGGALGPRYVIVGIVIAVAASILWLFDTTRTAVAPADATNVDHRFVAPLALPVAAFVLTITIAFSFSRVLLAVSETASWIIGIIVAAMLLLILTLIANRVPATKVVGGVAGVEPLSVGLVVASTYKPGAHWRPRNLSPGLAVLALLSHALPARRQPRMALEVLQRAVKRARVVKSSRGEAREVVDSILGNCS